MTLPYGTVMFYQDRAKNTNIRKGVKDMLLHEWVENKKTELLKSKEYKSVIFASVGKVEIERNMTTQAFNLFSPNEKVNMNTEVEDFIRSEVTMKIDGLKITFEVIKPRCRKSEKLYLYVKVA